MLKYHVDVTLSNGIEVNFSREAESSKAIFAEISNPNSWYEYEEKEIKHYFKTNEVVSFRIYEKKISNNPAGF